jgi:alcohol dehydrogenase class IV
MPYAELSGAWNYPTSIIAGAGTVARLPECCQQLGINRPLLVTDPGLAGLPMVTQALASCRGNGVQAGLFSEVKSNPNSANVMGGVAAFRAGDHDGVIAFGGGSAIDAAKTIALMVGQSRPLWDFIDVGDNWLRVDAAGIAPLIAIPTTAGTGSEVGRAALITDEDAHVKRIIFHPGLLPARVILDPVLTCGLPAHITAATGMDALSHNLEALCSSVWHPLAEGIAVEGIRLVREYLPLAVADGGNVTARMQMIVASSMGATAFQKGLGAMHALAHPLGALFDAHHGLLNARVMPYVLAANREAIGERIERLARYVGLEDQSFNGFMAWVLALRQQIGIPHTLAGIGIDTQQQVLVGEMAAVDPTAATNPMTFTASEYAELFARAVRGDLATVT